MINRIAGSFYLAGDVGEKIIGDLRRKLIANGDRSLRKRGEKPPRLDQTYNETVSSGKKISNKYKKKKGYHDYLYHRKDARCK